MKDVEGVRGRVDGGDRNWGGSPEDAVTVGWRRWRLTADDAGWSRGGGSVQQSVEGCFVTGRI